MILVNGLVALDANKVLGGGELAVEVGSVDHHFLVLSEAASGFLHNAECHGKHLGEGFLHIIERQLVEFVYLVEDGLALIDWRVFNLGLELCYLLVLLFGRILHVSLNLLGLSAQLVVVECLNLGIRLLHLLHDGLDELHITA